MSVYYEIAYAAASNRLCLFTGTGFSKAVTNNSAPGWEELLIECCSRLPNASDLKSKLFPVDEKQRLPLEEVAQVIALQLQTIGLNLHQIIATRLRGIGQVDACPNVTHFFRNNSVKVVTTNYDKIIEWAVGQQDAVCVSPGMPIPRHQARVEVYHVHGSIDSPENMVVTANDYFKFINSESYFSRKLSTLLHENMIVILGYSLADANLKAIISDHNNFSRQNLIGGSLVFVSRDSVAQPIKDYYAHSYGIRVLDETGIEAFFWGLNSHLDIAVKHYKESRDAIINCYQNPANMYHAEFLSAEGSFFQILAAIPSAGYRLSDPMIVDILKKVIDIKRELTRRNGAWDQYNHLAKWLIHLGGVLEVERTALGGVYLEAVHVSMLNMAMERKLGYSWQVYWTWYGGWMSISAANREAIRRYIRGNNPTPDMERIVGLA